MIGVTVGSPVAGVAGSSLDTAGSSALATAAWLESAVTPCGTVASIAARKLTVAVTPAASSPRSTVTGEPVPAVPCEAWSEPGTRLVWAGSGSVSTTAVAAVLPWLAIAIW